MEKRKTIIFAAIAMAILVTAMSMGCVEEPGEDLEEMEKAEELSFDEAIADIKAVATGCSGQTESVVEDAGKQISRYFEKTKEEYCN